MKRIYAKLRSQRGVSILYGLLFMLVALMVTVVMLDASVTATKRVHSDEERTQDMLTLQSAAETLRNCLSNTTFTTSITLDEEGSITEAEVTNSSGPLADLLEHSFDGVAEQLKNNTPEDISVEELAFEVDTGGVAEVIDDASIEFAYTMPVKSYGDDEGMYSLRITISMPNSDRQLFLWANSTTTSETPDTTLRTDTTVWKSENIAINTQKGKLWEQSS